MNTTNKLQFKPLLSYAEASEKAESIIMSLTIDERIELIGGHNFFFVKGVEKAGIPKLYLADATQGIHIRRNLPDQMEKSVAFPCPIALTATWNTQLAHDYAKSIGEECRAGGVDILLGPGMNIYRISQNGRNFEYFGEDPYLAARMIENYVVGVQGTGTIATLKHFVANNTDYMRRKSNSKVDLRTLHEIYLPAFKAGIDAGALAVMTAYNKVNDEYAAESNYVINDLLRKQLGFKWLVMSDWWSIYNPEKAIKSGLDLDMPGHGDLKQEPLTALGDIYVRSRAKLLLSEGKVCEDDINRMARNIVATSLAMGFDQRPQKDLSYLKKFPEHEQIALQTAREGIVLLKNDDQFLPLTKGKVSNIILTGKNIDNIPSGGGAAFVDGYNNISMLQALTDEYGSALQYIAKPSDTQIESAETVIVSVGTDDSEGWDMSFDLPKSVNDDIIRYTLLNKNIIVVVNSGGGRNMQAWNDKVKAILYCWYPGQVGFKALAEIISGKVNPSGKLPISIEQQFEDSPGYPYIPDGQEIYTGWPDDFNAQTPVYDIEYNEGIMVGYRWYESKNIKPLYAFGHGLSYTQFEYLNMQVQIFDGAKVKVQCSIKNSGSKAGYETVQLYINDIEASVLRPEKELKAFSKIYLEPNETRELTFDLENDAFSFFDSELNSWKMEAGSFEILIGAASNNIKLSAKVELL